MSRHTLFYTSIIVSLCCLTNSCKKDDVYRSNAVITGFDARACPCCGGLMISFTGETEPYKGDFKLIENTAEMPIQATDTFPIYVKLDWSNATNICSGNNYITVKRIKKI